MLRAFGLTGYRIPWYSFTMRFRRISYPIFPRCRDAPTTAIDRGENTASRRAPVILAAKLPSDNEPCPAATTCIITPGNRALRLIYRDGNRVTTDHRMAPFGAAISHGERTFRPASKDRRFGHPLHDDPGGHAP